jgi:hypothetical protein
MPPDSRKVLLDALPGPAQEALGRSLDRRGAGRLRLTCRAWRDTVDASTERLELIPPYDEGGSSVDWGNPRLRQRPIALKIEPLVNLLRRCPRVRAAVVHFGNCRAPGQVAPLLAALWSLTALEVGTRAQGGSCGQRRSRNAHAWAWQRRDLHVCTTNTPHPASLPSLPFGDLGIRERARLACPQGLEGGGVGAPRAALLEARPWPGTLLPAPAPESIIPLHCLPVIMQELRLPSYCGSLLFSLEQARGQKSGGSAASGGLWERPRPPTDGHTAHQHPRAAPGWDPQRQANQ